MSVVSCSVTCFILSKTSLTFCVIIIHAVLWPYFKGETTLNINGFHICHTAGLYRFVKCKEPFSQFNRIIITVV